MSSPIPHFGFQVSTDGSGFTWAREQPAESDHALVERSGRRCAGRSRSMCATRTPARSGRRPPLPIREKTAPYTVRHGQGYSRFEHDSHGIALELTQFVPLDDPVKISRLKIANQSGRDAAACRSPPMSNGCSAPTARRTAPFIVTEIDPRDRRDLRAESLERRISASASPSPTWAASRPRGPATAREFLGRDGTLDRPLALTPGAPLSNRVGAGLDPCGALQTQVRLSAVGATRDRLLPRRRPRRGHDAQALIAKYRKRRSRRGVRRGHQALGRHARHRAGQDAGPRAGYPGQSLAALSDPGLPRLGAHRLLSGQRRLRLPRPAAGRDGAVRAAARPGARASAARGGPAVPRRRRAALVAAGIRATASAPASPTTAAGWPMSSRIMSRSTGDTACSTRLVPFLEGPVLHDGEHDAFFQPTISRQHRQPVRALRAGAR